MYSIKLCNEGKFSLLIVGAFFGNLAISPIMSFAGRRPSVILATLFVLTSWLGVALIPSYFGILAARVIGGLGCGALDVAVVTFLAELSPTRKRGMATGMAGAGSMWGK
ncbi:putative high-affinity hexose transporter ght7 [Portunus trituberculatus]|uniref:Putative high-affinity hexose transporter ght7 n=1 Tax=Portunus trituberculatus TaxID=210409 RepID=A0A5B7HBD8_PORTR|nr:putative high-affinity hexose transporter ght7 [Portunus trituberculatus]